MDGITWLYVQTESLPDAEGARGFVAESDESGRADVPKERREGGRAGKSSTESWSGPAADRGLFVREDLSHE
jgi:hypothetical protein